VRLRVVVVGIPGVGKTTVVDKLVSKVNGGKLVTFGTVMFEEAKRRKWVKNRDELRKLTVDRQKGLQSLAASRISRMREGTVIVDTHLFIRTKEGFWPGLPFEVVRALKPTHFVLVEANPEEILSRRVADKNRYRDTMTRDELVEELGLARAFLTVSSTLTGAPMLIVRNAEGASDRAVGKIAEMLGEAVG
jgi:adenylate kinase